MKKIIALALCLAIAFCFASCEKEQVKEVLLYKTLDDVFNADVKEIAYSFSKVHFVYVFRLGDIYYRAITGMTDEKYEELSGIGELDGDRDGKIKNAAAPLEVKKIENISERAMGQADLEKYIGQKGNVPLDDGFSVAGFEVNGEKPICRLQFGMFIYTVDFEEEITADGDISVDEILPTLTIKKIRATDISKEVVTKY